LGGTNYDGMSLLRLIVAKVTTTIRFERTAMRDHIISREHRMQLVAERNFINYLY
jgi:hypothetical protein